MSLKYIKSYNNFTEELKNAGSRIVVCNFSASWCGLCNSIKPYFMSLTNLYPKAVYFYIDIDSCQSLAYLYKVFVLPTIIVIQNSHEIDRLTGSDINTASINHLISSNLNNDESKNKQSTLPEEKAWLENFLFYVEQVKQYEDDINQTLALSLIPLEDLQNKSTVNGKLNEYNLAKNLMIWFHDSFFVWVNTPLCEKCNCPTQNSNIPFLNKPLTDEIINGASTVELYICQKCNINIRFPRYNNVAKLLETKRGRCGEWANCFALFCRAVNFETRFVTDNLDHVWVEVFSKELDRWLHLDPCEVVIDTPLMYDKGWGKKYSYVIAFARDHVRDVTWRYSFDYKETIKRRTKVREPILRNFLTKLNNRLTKDLPKERQDFLLRIYANELVEFFSPLNQLRNDSEAENQGRKSGSLEWRKQRGEQSSSDSIKEYIIKPTNNEIKAKALILNYNVVTNEYLRPNDSNIPIKGWETLTKEFKNVFRKNELDWKMIYLCRTSNSSKGYIVWNIDLSDLDAIKAKITLGQRTTYHNGKILSSICYRDSCALISNDDDTIFLDDINGCKYLEIRVEFSSGTGDCAWQHAQLFRTETSKPINNFIVEVYFN